MKSLHNVLRHFLTLFFACFLFAFFSCENAVTSATENQMEAVEEKSSQKAYIVLKLVEPNNTAASNARAVTSGVTSSLFSNITFSGTRADGVSITPVTAESFTELAGQSIEVEPGDWTFELEAWLGKTASAEGEKYTASQNLTVVAGTNELKMKLASDSASEAVPTSHPGSWEVAIKFPAETIDLVTVWLLNYSDFAVSGTDPASLTKLYSKNYVKGSDFTSSGQQTLRAGETNRACGNYIVYVSFLKNVGQQGEDIETEVINNWGEFMRINPGVKSTGTITLPNADKTYTIQYNLGGAQWNLASTENIQISYTRNSGSAGIITLPTQASFVDRGPLYSFEGWYTDEDFAAGTGPVTSFNVSDAENKIFYAKWHEPVYDIYIQAGADDSIADGSKARPFSTVSLSVYQTFDDITGTNADGTYKSTIHILSDYTGANKITFPWGNGDDSLTGMCVNFVGEKGRVSNADVTLDVNVPDNKSFVYVEKAQRIRFSHINITSSKDYTDPNGFGCLSCVNGTELIFEDSTIKGYTAKGCTGINVEGVAYIRNCEISGNYAIDANADAPNPGTGQSNIWGCAVNAKNGFLHIGQNVVIKNNRILKDDGSGEEETESYNLYIGGYESGSLTFTPVIIDSSLDGCEIWVKLAEEPRTFTSGYGTQTEAVSTYFHSDSGMEVRLVSGEARLAAIRHLYVASNGHDDSSADGTEAKPYASIAHAIQQLNNNEIDATIYVVDEVLCNTTIVNSGASGGQPLVANSLIIEGTGTDSALNGNTNGSVLVLKTSVPITINNLTIKNGSSSNYGGGLYIDGSIVEINNCIIENNKAVTQGGGVYVAASSSLIMNGSDSLIRNNRVVGDRINPSPVTPETKKGGGGVFIAEGGSFTMNAGTIRGNGTTDSGGGLYIRGNFTMESGTITSNKNYSYNSDQTTLDSNFSDSIKTDNVEIGIPGNFEMKGGTITSELASGGACGGVCVYAEPAFFNDPAGTANFTMSGGLIEGITSSKAAVYLSAISSSELYNLEFNMTGGTIKGNTATGTGGAVSLGKFSHFTMSGGEISGNHAEGSGGGVYLENSTTNAPTITLGVSGKTGDIKIKDNTYGASDTECNIYLKSSDIITVAGPLAATSEVGVTRAGTFSSTPFTSGFGSTNGTISPADVFTSDEAYTIIAGTGGEAAFLTYSPSGTIYAPSDYHFTLAASRSSVTLGRAANVTVTPDITRTEPNGNSTPLFYNPSDRKLYLDSAFTLPEGSDSTVTWSASLWCGTEVEVPNLSAGTGANANKFTIPALSFENTYTLNVTATYQGYTHNANLPLQCQAGGALSIPLTLEAVSSAATVTFKNKASGPVTYIVNGGEAQTIAAKTTGTVTLSAAGDKVEFFGDNARYGSGSTQDCSKISCSSDCYIYGNIMSLINSTGYETANALTANYCFSYLFSNNSKIKNKTGSELMLPATTLSDNCYYYMFCDCTSLTTAPELPATLSEACYKAMFKGCTSLTTAPELPATTLRYWCYQSMFEGCTSLTTAPELPATTLSISCYYGMFKGCTSLTTAPELPATTLATECYYGMFEGCTSLTTAPELPATTLAMRCYYGMFEGCTSLTTAPELPATTLATRCYYTMFSNCTGLTTAPELPATSLRESCYYSMFQGCTSLNSVTCLATDISASDCVNNWLDNVAASGTFIKAAGMTDWPSGANGIPSGWTVQDAP